ncbi:MAG: hypothetical protein M0000_02135 [Actinomycetota bacterium]|nr:hypothetical protein [Actinomycetota bacterium]
MPGDGQPHLIAELAALHTGVGSLHAAVVTHCKHDPVHVWTLFPLHCVAPLCVHEGVQDATHCPVVMLHDPEAHVPQLTACPQNTQEPHA